MDDYHCIWRDKIANERWNLFEILPSSSIIGIISRTHSNKIWWILNSTITTRSNWWSHSTRKSCMFRYSWDELWWIVIICSSGWKIIKFQFTNQMTNIEREKISGWREVGNLQRTEWSMNQRKSSLTFTSISFNCLFLMMICCKSSSVSWRNVKIFAVFVSSLSKNHPINKNNNNRISTQVFSEDVLEWIDMYDRSYSFSFYSNKSNYCFFLLLWKMSYISSRFFTWWSICFVNLCRWLIIISFRSLVRSSIVRLISSNLCLASILFWWEDSKNSMIIKIKSLLIPYQHSDWFARIYLCNESIAVQVD